MGRYSIPEPDEKLLESLKGSKSVLIVGCTHCANISIGHDRNLPIFHITHNEKTGIKSKPVAVLKEAERLKRFLESNGLDACIETVPLICAAIESNEAEILVPMGFPPYLKDRDVDAALALTCTGEGLTGVKRMVGDGVKVVSGMLTVGGHEPVLVYDAASGDVFVDRDKSVFKRRQ